MPQPLSAFTDLQASDARSQFRLLTERDWRPRGVKQVDFIPVETLLCLFASLVVDHRKFGGKTAHLAPEPVASLAELFKRPNSSVLAKMANLDGSRSNGAKHEMQGGVILLSDLERFTSTYVVIFNAARSVGFAPEALPDFLGLETGGEFFLRGQEEIDDLDFERFLRPEVDGWSRKRSDFEEALTVKIVEVSARVGQHRFAGQVLESHGHRCVFCGLGLQTQGRPAARMLVASHIKPWRVGTRMERLDPLNGPTACPTHDVAFDTGLIGIDADMRVRIRPDLRDRISDDSAIRDAFGGIAERGRLLLPEQTVRPRVDYVRWHGENIFQASVA